MHVWSSPSLCSQWSQWSQWHLRIVRIGIPERMSSKAQRWGWRVRQLNWECGNVRYLIMTRQCMTTGVSGSQGERWDYWQRGGLGNGRPDSRKNICVNIEITTVITWIVLEENHSDLRVVLKLSAPTWPEYLLEMQVLKSHPDRVGGVLSDTHRMEFENCLYW